MSNKSFLSRYFNLDTRLDTADRLVLLKRTPFRFEDREDNIHHEAGTGERWWHIAERYYTKVAARACGLWWVVADYQPTPIVDPTLKIRPGTIIICPAPVVVQSEILGIDPEVYL